MGCLIWLFSLLKSLLNFPLASDGMVTPVIALFYILGKSQNVIIHREIPHDVLIVNWHWQFAVSNTDFLNVS